MEQSTSQKQFAAPRMDTVEISTEGKAASTKLQARQTDTSTTEEYQYEEEDLSQYPDAELKQMYHKGEITRQEYEEETKS